MTTHRPTAFVPFVSAIMVLLGMLLVSSNALAATQWYATCASTESGNGKSKLCRGSKLLTDQTLVSPNGSYVMKIQSDGNLVIYQGGTAIWSTGKNGQGASYLWLQDDNNLVTYKNTGGSTWATGTNARGNISHLTLDNTGNAVLYCKSGIPLWTSRKGRLFDSCGSCAIATTEGVCGNFKNTPTAQDHTWTGTQNHQVVDAAAYWHRCTQSPCGAATMATGSSNCETTTVEVGFNYNVPIPPNFGSLDISGGYTNTYEVCNTRTYSATCYPKGVGWETRAEIRQIREKGVKKFSGELGQYLTNKTYSCPLGGDWYPTRGGNGYCVRGQATVYREGFWPRSSYSQCTHRTF